LRTPVNGESCALPTIKQATTRQDGSVSALARTGVIVAIDGPSGSGKSSTSRGVATRLGLRYLDTGAMYRAMTWWMLRQHVPVDDPVAVSERCGAPTIVAGTDPRHPTITVDGTDVAAAIRTPEVTGAVSAVSAVPQVRARLLQLQRAAIRSALEGPGIVVEGRDIGAVVAPDADVKIYLTADATARAARRAAEQGGSDLAATQSSLLARDRVDSTRIDSPLAMAEDAVHVDSTPYTLEEVVDLIVRMVDDA
jgi:CMP/dCMP kinase